jgi:hypothetical protein
MKNINSVAALAILVALSPAVGTAETLTYKDLVRRLTDLEHLAVLPESGEKGALASSYDRSSRYDAATDKYIAWDANYDGDGCVRKEGDTTVLAEIQGPACIWRTWSATATAGHVKIYLDGQEIPVIDRPFAGFFDRWKEPFTRKNLVYKTTAKGYNNYTPIPFQKSCKIVAEKDWGKYFHFNYTTFPAGTVVPTFKVPLAAEDSAALDEADRIMGQCGQDPAGARPGQKSETKTVTVPAGQKVEAIKLDGPEAITGLKAKLDLPKDVEQQRTLLAQLTISITWDDETQPAVWSPLGDFFASAAGATSFSTLPVGLSKDGTFYCYWYMPFGKSAKIEIGNDSAQPVTIAWDVTHASLDKPLEQLGRFHAKWHRDAFLPTRKDRKIDWTLVTTQGRGRFVGTQLHVWNPRGGWWGEGDEKFFVDGEKFPSTFGTGSEDYFGYAWGPNKLTFVQALHSEPVNEDDHGHVSVNRWHIADNIPFQTSFEGSIEKYFPNSRTPYAAVAFWYLSPGGTDPYKAAPVSERAGWWVRPEIYREAGAIEGESLKILNKPEHNPRVQDDLWQTVPNVFSGDAQLFWNANAIGEKIDLELPSQPAGKYRVIARFGKENFYGVCQVSLAGQKIGSPVDLFDRHLTATDPSELGIVDIPEGKPVLTVVATGKNELSHGYSFGLDYIKLVPVQ